jgi:hypothetical protein
MDQQGAGRTRSASDTHRQPPWPSLEGTGVSAGLENGGPANSAPPSTGPVPTRPPGYGAPGYGTGGYSTGGYSTGGYGPPGSGAQRVLSPGTGPQRLSGSGSGAQQVLPSGSAHRVPGPGTGPQRLSGSGSGAQQVLPSGSAHRVPGPGTGPQRLSGSGSGAQQVLPSGSGAHRIPGPGTGPQRLSGSASGPNPVLHRADGPPAAFGAPAPFPEAGSAGSAGRTPVRGFPPGREPAEPSQGGPSEDAYPDDDTRLESLLAPADGQGQGARPGRRRGGRTKRRFRTWLAASVAVVAAAGFVSYKFLYEPTVNAPVPPTLRLPTTAPGSGSPGFDKALGQWQHIGTRAEDPEPLTIAGLYPPQFILNGSSYVRTAASVTKTCSRAVYGADLQAALQSGHCTQALRASYISGDGKLMGTVGVVNLISSSAAQEAGQATGPQEIIAPLTGKKGATSKLGSGTGVVQAEVKGHYLILMWAEFANLKSPSGSAKRNALEQFAANLVIGSANINLSTRMLTGKP